MAAVASELKTTKSASDKTRDSKAAVSVELAALKAAAKRLTAYTKAIATADKVLKNQQRKEKRESR